MILVNSTQMWVPHDPPSWSGSHNNCNPQMVYNELSNPIESSRKHNAKLYLIQSKKHNTSLNRKQLTNDNPISQTWDPWTRTLALVRITQPPLGCLWCLPKVSFYRILSRWKATLVGSKTNHSLHVINQWKKGQKKKTNQNKNLRFQPNQVLIIQSDLETAAHEIGSGRWCPHLMPSNGKNTPRMMMMWNWPIKKHQIHAPIECPSWNESPWPLWTRSHTPKGVI